MWRSWKIERFAFVIATILLAATGGCILAPSSGIDPTGEHVISPAVVDENPLNQRYYDNPMGKLPWDPIVVLVDPPEKVAPVGSEVILRAGVGGDDGYLQTNRRLEWTIAADSVGQFTDVEKSGFVDLLLCDFTFPRKVNNSYAIGSTGRSNIRLNRGTCSPEDDVWVLRGQGWVSLTSPVEGTTHVTVLAPSVHDWNLRTRTAVIHWVDAQWQYPPPSISPAGARQPLTTTVLRQSDQSPCEGWRVRYRIAGGPQAGFAPDGVQEIETPVDSAGRATVEIFQLQPAHGTNQICIDVIRPGNITGAGGRTLVIDQGSTTQTWSAPDLAVKMTGPAAANVGDTLTYRIEVSNPGDLSLKDATVSYDVPAELTLIDSVPRAEAVGNSLVWRIGELGARQVSAIDVRLQAQKQGNVTNCCQATAAGGLKSTGCATTNVGLSSLEVRLTGPEQAKVGDELYFKIFVTNHGQTPATDLVITDRLDPGLELKDPPGKKIIRRKIEDLPAGQTAQYGVTLLALGPGRLCHEVELTGPAIATTTASACISIAASEEQPSPTPSWDARPSLNVEITGPAKATIGDLATFNINITNSGTTAATNLKVIDSWDYALMPREATRNSSEENGNLVWNIAELQAGQSARISVKCECQAASIRACNRVIVELSDGTRVEKEACVEIVPPAEPPPLNTPDVAPPPAADLTFTAVGLTNPVEIGKNMTYEIRVTNKGITPCKNVTVTAVIPEGMAVYQMGTMQVETLGVAASGAPQFNGQTVSFKQVDVLESGKSLTFRVRVRATKVGNYRFRAELRSPDLPEPLVKEEETEVFQRRYGRLM